ncbi:hypothetical protein INS49_003099 [Diaporthe citri]|uniref:uncharacterized protein n=1 Tax=Diaporthe citri TaxID=83186 RepID=UPI001C822E95|nr:uncharacterized protein INS49_003099 [Diaporthe citri]KAG6368881.1 hypothetical protein INS49_003099 [Diaporthe citri]
MDLQASSDERPGPDSPGSKTAQEEITPDVTEENVTEKGIKAEKYAYYGLFAANNGIGPYQYQGVKSAYSLFQTLIYQAAFNPNILPWGSASCDEDPDAPCHVTWAGGTKSYESVALIASALVFVGQSILFIFIGSTADYGSWAPWILRISVLIYGGLSLGFFGLKTPDAWPAAMALYTLTNIGFYVVFTFGYALFPRISDDQPEARKARLALQNQEITSSEYDTKIEHVRSTIANHAWAANNVGFAVSACLCVGILKGIDADSSASKNNLGYALCTGVVGIIVLVLSVPWVFLEKRRPRLPVPEGRNIVSYGLQQTWHSFKYCRRISQTFLYLFVYFWLKTTVRSSTLPTGHASLAVWGMVGLWTRKIGYHNLWEFWAVSVFYGPSVGLQMSYSQVFLGQVIPRGEENRYFALLGFIGRVGSWIGPLICSAIVDRTGTQNASYGFLAALIGASSLGLIFVDEAKSKLECAEYEATEHKVAEEQEPPLQGKDQIWEAKT